MSDNSSKPVIFTRSFLMITIVNLFIFFSFQMILPTLPLYIHQLGGNDSVVGLVIGVFTITSLLTRPFAGLALDEIGRKPIIIAGLIILTICAFAYSLATSIGIIILIRLIHGMGWGFSSTAVSTFAAEIIPHQRFGEGMGYFSLANSISMAIAPASGIYIARRYGFSEVFATAGTLALCALVLSSFLQYRKLEPLKVAVKEVKFYEKSAYLPTLMMFFISLTWGGVISFLPLYAFSRGISHIGIFFTVYAMSIFISRPLAGKLVDKYGFNVTIIPGLSLVILAMLLIYSSVTKEMFLLSAFIYGLGFGATQMSLQTMVVKDVVPNHLGAANATFFSGLDAGMGLGAVLFGLVANYAGYPQMFTVAAALVFCALLIFLNHLRLAYKAIAC